MGILICMENFFKYICEPQVCNEDKLAPKDWCRLYSLAHSQGVGSIVWSNIGNKSLLPKVLKIQWALEAEYVKINYNNQKRVIKEISNIFAAHLIKTYCLKGLSLSQYYPIPSLRECGDFDCYLDGNFDYGNAIAVNSGADFDPHDYRHSLILYKGLQIENHRYFLPIRANARNKRLERYLREVINCDNKVEDIELYKPSAQFHALFIILHMLQHFLYENITIRHMLDWVYFVNSEKEYIDWREFNSRCEEAGAAKFVAALNYICESYLRLNIDGTLLCSNKTNAAKILSDTIEQKALRVSKIQSLWSQRLAKVRNIYEQKWKFDNLYDRSFISSILQPAIGILIEKNVKL